MSGGCFRAKGAGGVDRHDTGQAILIVIFRISFDTAEHVRADNDTWNAIVRFEIADCQTCDFSAPGSGIGQRQRYPKESVCHHEASWIMAAAWALTSLPDRVRKDRFCFLFSKHAAPSVGQFAGCLFRLQMSEIQLCNRVRLGTCAFDY